MILKSQVKKSRFNSSDRLNEHLLRKNVKDNLFAFNFKCQFNLNSQSLKWNKKIEKKIEKRKISLFMFLLYICCVVWLYFIFIFIISVFVVVFFFNSWRLPLNIYIYIYIFLYTSTQKAMRRETTFQHHE